jgi:RTX calcium-binding nonapeptide repeat (4 copies)
VTAQSGSIQRAIDADSDGSTIHVETATYASYTNVNNVPILFTVAINPGFAGASYAVAGQGSFTGSTTLELAPGGYMVTDGALLGGTTFGFQVDALGNVSSQNANAAQGGLGTLALLAATTTTVTSSPTVSFSPTTQTFTVSATITSPAGTPSGGTVTFDIAGGSDGSDVMATVDGTGLASTTFTLNGGVAPNTYTITATYGGNGNFGGSNSSTSAGNGSLMVTKASQTISFAVSSPVTYGVAPINLTATGGNSGNPVTFAIISGPGSLLGNVLTVTGAGDILLEADQAGNANYMAAPPVQRTLHVNAATGLTAGIAGPSSGVRGQPRTFTFTANASGNFNYTINWGDGSAIQHVMGPASIQVTHVFAETAMDSVSLTVANGGGTSQPAAQTISITAYAIQISPIDGKRELVVGSGGHNSEVEIEKAPGSSGGVVVEIENAATEHLELTATVADPIDRLVLYGQKSDQLSVAGNVKIDAVLHAGTGSSILQGGGGNDILIGGPGNDILIAGQGRDLLIGGTGHDVECGGSGQDIVIGGTTNFDANDAALLAIMKEWTRQDEDYNTRVAHVTGTSSGGLNGAYVLNATTVHDDGMTDLLIGGPGKDLLFHGLGDIVL